LCGNSSQCIGTSTLAPTALASVAASRGSQLPTKSSMPLMLIRYSAWPGTGYAPVVADGRTSFPAQVYDVVRAVPAGRVTTYGAVARALGAAGRAREVGWALAALRGDDHDVPAHRVVNARGALSGGWAFGAPEVQRALLEAEGVAFDDRACVRLDRHLWQPGVPDLRAES